MYVLTNKEMREADKYTIENLSVPSLVLMERAGEEVANLAQTLAPTGKITVVCGGGNNGGDGFVCARLLKACGREVRVICRAEKFSVDCLENKKRWEQVQGEIVKNLDFDGVSLVIDCLYGTGFKGILQGDDLRLVEKINAFQEKGGMVLSADIPSGVNGENGLVIGNAVKASVTLCIGEAKTGVLLNDGKDYRGKVKVADIGIRLPKNNYAVRVDGGLVLSLLPKRRQNSHKGTYGKAAIVAGSIEYTGAPYLALKASLRSGVGYATLFAPENILPYLFGKCPEGLLKPLKGEDRVSFNEKQFEEMLGFDSIVYGMGMGCTEETYWGAKYLLERYLGRLILDADGLNSLAKYGKTRLKELFAQKKCDVLITPHVKELSRLTDYTVEEILQSPIEISRAVAKEYGICVLLKGATTVLTDGEEVYLNDTGNSAQAKAGSGDALSGLIAGLCAQGISDLHGGVCGSYLLGISAEMLKNKQSERSILPSDCIENIGRALFATENAHEGSDQ